ATITPPRSGMFSIPENSIFQSTRLNAPTTGRILSSAHCGSIVVLAAARGSSRLAAPLLLAVLTVMVVILQRPFLIYELDMNSRNAVSALAARANGCVYGDPVLLARQTN